MLGEHHVERRLDQHILHENVRFGIALHVFIEHEIDAAGARERLEDHAQWRLAELQQGDSILFQAQLRLDRLGKRALRENTVQHLFRFAVVRVRTQDMPQLRLCFLNLIVADQILGHPDLELVHFRILCQLEAGQRLRIGFVQFQHVLIEPASLREARSSADRIRFLKLALDDIFSRHTQLGLQERTVRIFFHRVLHLSQPDIQSPGIDVRHPLVE